MEYKIDSYLKLVKIMANSSRFYGYMLFAKHITGEVVCQI
jgi:hypothetical protein